MNSQNQIFMRSLLAVIVVLFLVGAYGCSKDNSEDLFRQGVEAVAAGKPDDAIIWLKKALQENPEMAMAHYKLGEVYHKKGDIRLAYGELSRALQQDTQLKEARKELAFLLVENRGLDQAVTVCQTYLEVNGDDKDIYLILANSLAYTNRIDEAVKVLQTGRKIYPEDIAVQINLAKMFVVQGETEKGKSLLEALAEEKPDKIAVQLALAQLYQKIERFDLAVLTLEGSKKRFPENPLPFLALAELSLKKNKPDNAKEILFAAEKSGIHDSNIYRMIAMIDHRLGNSEAALDYFKKAVESATAETRQMNLMILADYLSYLKQYKEAQDVLLTIIAEDSSKKELKSKVVELFLAQGEYDQARTSVEALLQEDSSDARGHFLKGLMMMQDKEVTGARKEFSRAKDLAPNAAENQFLYGVTFLEESEQIAITEINEALKKNSNLLKARMALAELYAKNGEFQKTLDELDAILAVQNETNELDKVVGRQADTLKVRVLRIAVLMKMKKPELALEDAKLLVKQQPEVKGHKLRLAEIYFLMRDFKNSLPLYEELQKNDPENVQILNRIVGIYTLDKDYGQALKTVDQFLEKYPDNIDAVMVKAKVYISQGTLGLAEKLLLPVADKGKEVGAVVMLAGLYDQQKKIALAVKYYQKALEAAPDDLGIMMKLADLYLKNGDNDQAITSYENVLKQKDDFLPAMNNLAFLYSEENRNLDRALQLADKVYEKLPENPNVADTLGWIYVMKNVFSQAEQYLRQASESLPDNASVNYHLGMLYYKQGQQQEAEKMLTKAVEKGLSDNELKGAQTVLAAVTLSKEKIASANSLIDSGHPDRAILLLEEVLANEDLNNEAAASLAALYAEQNQDINKALELAEKAYDSQPDNPQYCDSLGWVYYHQGSLLLAKQYMEQAIEFDDKYGPAYVHLAAVYLKKEEPENAQKMLEIAKGLNLSASDKALMDKIGR